MTAGGTDHPGGYRGAMADFYAEAAARLARHLLAGRDVVVLCEGDPSLYGSYLHLHDRLGARFCSTIVPGVSSVSAAAAAAAVPLVQHDEVLTVLPGTLPAGELRARLAGADAAAVLKLGRTFGSVRSALADTGLLGRARYVERAGTDAERVEPLADVDPDRVPYMSLALVPGPRPPPGPRARGDRRGPGTRRPGLAHPGGVRGPGRRHGPGRLPAVPGPAPGPARAAAARVRQHGRGGAGPARAGPGRLGPPGRGRVLG